MRFFHTHAHTSGGAFRHPQAYDRVARHLRSLYARVVADVAAAEFLDSGRVLDVGTGPGRVPLALAEARPGLRVEGIDLSEEMVEHARHAAVEAGLQDRVAFSVGDVTDLEYPDDSFDLIISTLSQHHWADVDGGIRELLRVLKPTGQIWIYDGRFQLRKAEAAARDAGPSVDVRSEVLRNGPLWLRLIARLRISRTR